MTTNNVRVIPVKEAPPVEDVHDDDPTTCEDPLAPARGVLLGALLGLLFWSSLGYVVAHFIVKYW